MAGRLLRPSFLRRLSLSSGRAFLSTTSRNYADMSFTFASPGEVFYVDSKVQQVDVPSLNGDFGVLPGHVPVLGTLRPGVVTVHEESGGQNRFFVSSGSITINDDSSVQILAEEAAPLDRLDPKAVTDGLSKAQQEMSSASNERERAEAQIALDCFDALQKSLTAK